jgi:hypothetical protein
MLLKESGLLGMFVNIPSNYGAVKELVQPESVLGFDCLKLMFPVNYSGENHLVDKSEAILLAKKLKELDPERVEATIHAEIERKYSKKLLNQIQLFTEPELLNDIKENELVGNPLISYDLYRIQAKISVARILNLSCYDLYKDIDTGLALINIFVIEVDGKLAILDLNN